MSASSTHTFLLYLSDCHVGGETVLLREVGGVADTALVRGTADELERLGVIDSVAPRRGRLLLFPHACPHAGAAVTAPKILIRGECL